MGDVSKTPLTSADVESGQAFALASVALNTISRIEAAHERCHAAELHADRQRVQSITHARGALMVELESALRDYTNARDGLTGEEDRPDDDDDQD